MSRGDARLGIEVAEGVQLGQQRRIPENHDTIVVGLPGFGYVAVTVTYT